MITFRSTRDDLAIIAIIRLILPIENFKKFEKKILVQDKVGPVSLTKFKIWFDFP